MIHVRTASPKILKVLGLDFDTEPEDLGHYYVIMCFCGVRS